VSMSGIEVESAKEIEYEVVSYSINNFEYKIPSTSVDDNGELQVKYEDKVLFAGSITFLQKWGRDNRGNVVEANPINIVNDYLLFKRIDDDVQNTDTHSKALLSYFSFLEVLGIEWDDMPFHKSKRPTYQYKKYLKQAYLSQNPDEHLARSTCNNYIGAVTGFYKHYLKFKHSFENDPFVHEIVPIRVQADATNMKATQSYDIHTTDLRLKLGRDKRNDGTKRELLPLSDNEWEVVNRILVKDRRIITVENGIEISRKIAVEYSLMFMLPRYTGLRRVEVATLRERHIRNPTPKDEEKGYCAVDIGPANNSKAKNDTDHTIHVPLPLMRLLHSYVNSKRYITRKNKYKSLIAVMKEANPDHSAVEKNLTPKILEQINKPDEAFIFLKNAGKPYAFSPNTINARWTDIRRTTSKILGYTFEHKPHNLRSTYAVWGFRILLKKGISPDDALVYIKNRLGHCQASTTIQYLKFAQNEAKGDEVFEHALDFLLDDNDFEMAVN
jgi:integrase